MKELDKIIKWIDDYERDHFGTPPHANLIKQIIKCRVLEIKEQTKDFLCDRECSGENKCDTQCYLCNDMEK